MDLAKDGPTLTSARQTGLQSMEDFMREQDEADAQRAVELAANLAAFPSKKQRKAALEAERKAIEQQACEAVKGLGAVNWVGRLIEYRQAHLTPPGGLIYAEEEVGFAPPRYKCSVEIHESTQKFGNDILFSNKKDAKRYASKMAIDWLIENNYMPADGSVKFPKAPALPVVRTFDASPSLLGTPNSVPPTSFARQVPDSCKRLGFNPPTYVITQDSENSPLWSGYAHFGGNPKIDGKVGEVRGVFGKVKAKEQIATQVLSALKDIERQRMQI